MRSMFMRHRATPFVLAAALLCGTGAASAAPAHWYQWRSLQSGAVVCSQTPLGEGWVQADGPFADPGCQRKMRIIKL